MSEKVLRTTGGKKIRSARKSVDYSKNYSVSEAIEALKSINYTKFDQTIDIAINLGVDPKHSDQMVRGVVNLPAGTGKDVKVAVICKEDRDSEAKSSGADFVGAQDIIANIKAGKIDFDVCIATPDMMGSIGQVAKILGPKGLMPNPKLGTVTADIATAIKNAKSGQVEYRTEKAGIIHAGVGKMSFSTQDLISNVQALVSAVLKAKPANLKGTYLKSIYLASTMSPAFKLDTSSF